MKYARLAGVCLDVIVDDEIHLPGHLPSTPDHSGISKPKKGNPGQRGVVFPTMRLALTEATGAFGGYKPPAAFSSEPDCLAVFQGDLGTIYLRVLFASVGFSTLELL